MTPSTFRRLADAHGMRGRTREALELVLVGHLSAYAAARQIGVHESAISRARKRLESDHCPTCHRPL